MPPESTSTGTARTALSAILSSRLVRLLGVSTGAFGTVQAIRFSTNIVLARLLSPELFGLMVIIMALRTGLDLLSDVGFSQNFISNKNAEKPDFYNTLWTLQFLRGLILFVACLAVAYPLSWAYDMPVLQTALPLAAFYFLLIGSQSPSLYLLLKRVAVKQTARIEIGVAVLNAIATLAIVWAWPTIWGLILGNVAGTAAHMLVSYMVLPHIRPRFRLSREYAWQILHFGKWIFGSSILYFGAMNFDRLYLGQQIPLAILGVYGVARSFTDMFGTMVIRFGNQLIFPLVARSELPRKELRARLAGPRARSLLAAALGLSLFAALFPFAIKLLYDERYHAAAAMLPVLSAGIWLLVLCTLNEAVLLGIGKPVYQALSNAAKLIGMLILLPLALSAYGIAGVLAAVVLAEASRYVAIAVVQRREHLSFLGQDVAISLFALSLFLLWSALLSWAGLDADIATTLTVLRQLEV